MRTPWKASLSGGLLHQKGVFFYDSKAKDPSHCRGRHAVPVFGGAEYDYGAEEEKSIRKKWMTIPRSGCSDRGIGVCGEGMKIK